MNREQLYGLRSHILDRMGYILLNAPEFPAEDQTTLERERDEIASQMLQHRSTLRTEEQLTWHRLSEQEFTSAMNAFTSGDRKAGGRKLQQAEEHFRRSFQTKKIRPDFLIGPDGQITKT